jgi:hypothetical protein
MRWPFSPIVALAFAATPVSAQDHDAQLWLQLGASREFSDGLTLEFETKQRLSADDGGLYESQYLGAISVEVAEGVTLTGGVNRVIGISGGRASNTEWRPRQQISFPITNLGQGELAGRVRFEQRFRSDGDNVGYRLRPEISYALPLRYRLELQFAHESYLNLNTTDFGQDAGHERMRNSVALSLPIGKSVDAEVGYMNQYRFNGSERDLMEHALTTSLLVGF